MARTSHVEARSSRSAVQQFVAESHDHKPGPPWRIALYPGDAVRSLRLARGGVLGSIEAQRYAPSSIKVACFLPGREEQTAGDTPKTWPERYRWTSDKATADMVFDAFYMQALKEGWIEC